MQLGCFGFHRQIYPQEGDSKKKWKIEFFGKFDMPTISGVRHLEFDLFGSYIRHNFSWIGSFSKIKISMDSLDF